MGRIIKFKDNKLTMTDDYELIYEKKITKFGTGAKIDVPKNLIVEKVYVLVCKD